MYRFRRPTEADHGRISPVLDEWWGGRAMSALLPRLFFQHFTSSSWIAESDDGDLAGFLVAFVSQDHPDVGYIHFVGVAPDCRGGGLGRHMYERAFDDLRGHGCTVVKAITSPVNTASLGFHESLGFNREDSGEGADGVWRDYDGPEEDRVVMSRSLLGPT